MFPYTNPYLHKGPNGLEGFSWKNSSWTVYSYIFTEGPEDSIKGWRLFPIFIPVQQRLRGVKGPTQEWNNQFKEKIKNPIPIFTPMLKKARNTFSDEQQLMRGILTAGYLFPHISIVPTSIHYSRRPSMRRSPLTCPSWGWPHAQVGQWREEPGGLGMKMDNDRSICCWHL